LEPDKKLGSVKNFTAGNKKITGTKDKTNIVNKTKPSKMGSLNSTPINNRVKISKKTSNFLLDLFEILTVL
jgi:hypothetical protein